MVRERVPQAKMGYRPERRPGSFCFATKTHRVVTVSPSTQATTSTSTTLFLNFRDYVVLNRPDTPFLVRLHPIAIQDGPHTRFAILTTFGRIMEGPPDRTLEATTSTSTTLFLNFRDYGVLNRPDTPFLVRLHPIATIQDGPHTRFAILTTFGRIMEGPPDRTLEISFTTNAQPASHGPQPPKDLDESRPIE
ncbi:hypothetical protein EDD15DRAFT_2201397 [Pisolithus albus]|nr:hypothetical protein EDD15DRAFT_2201397 [Pisolithus albus]